MESFELARATSPELRTGATLLVPLGSTEQHGPHLPLDTDTRIAAAIATRAAARCPGVMVAPALPYGSSGEHQSFAGTLSIGTEVLVSVLVELTRSAAHGFGHLVFVNGHGGNHEAVIAAASQLNDEGHALSTWWPRAPGGDAHAGVTETSLMLAIDPDVVRLELAEAGNTAPLAELIEPMRTGGVAAVSANGVLGDPAGASPDAGARLLEALVADLVDHIAALAV